MLAAEEEGKGKNKLLARDPLQRLSHDTPAWGDDALGHDELGRNELGRNELGRNELDRDELDRDELDRDELPDLHDEQQHLRDRDSCLLQVYCNDSDRHDYRVTRYVHSRG